jgi:hypothetical protein
VPLVDEGAGVGAAGGAGGADDADGRGTVGVAVAGAGTGGAVVAGVGGACVAVTAVADGATGVAGGEYTVARVRDQTTTDAPAKAATQNSTMRMTAPVCRARRGTPAWTRGDGGHVASPGRGVGAKTGGGAGVR